MERYCAFGSWDSRGGFWIVDMACKHPFWKEGEDYQQVVTSTYVESGGGRIVIYSIAPSLDRIHLWERFDSNPPTMAVVTMTDHVRDIDMFVVRYGMKPYGPSFYFPVQIPKPELEPVIAEKELPGGPIPL